MSEGAVLERLADEAAVRRVRMLWAWSRDAGDWEGVRACFHPEATISISWYRGSAEGFIEQSQKMFARRAPEERSKHWLGNTRVELHGARATLETDVQILGRDRIEGHLFDYVAWGRFFDLLEKRDSQWRIAKWTCIYDKDRLDPVIPGSVPASFFAGLELEGPESGFAFMRLRHAKQGRTAAPGVVMGGSDDERRVRREGDLWLGRVPPTKDQ